MAPHVFPTFAKIYGWCMSVYLLNQAYLLYFYPERIVGKNEWMNWHETSTPTNGRLNGQSYYMTYKMTNWFLAARHLALAVFGMMALTKPPTMKGCIYLFSAFWILLIHCNLFDAMTSQWVAPARDNRAWAMWGCQQMDFPNMVFLIINGFALHQTWNVAYPAGEELVLNKPNHKNPTLSKITGWIYIVMLFFFTL